MHFWVYILRCRDGSYYTGHTDDLEKRLAEHQRGRGSVWTRTRLPVELVWSEWVNERYDALAFERRVKNWSRAKKEALIAGDWKRVGHFAKPPHERPSTSLGTNGNGGPAPGSEGGPAQDLEHGSSTSLGTHELGRLAPNPEVESEPDSFVPSEVEGRGNKVRERQ